MQIVDNDLAILLQKAGLAPQIGDRRWPRGEPRPELGIADVGELTGSEKGLDGATATLIDSSC